MLPCLFALMILLLLPAASLAATITVSTKADLLSFASRVNSGDPCTGDVYELTADIDIGGTWTPIGYNDTVFNGTFDGKGHKVTGYTISGYAKAGFFIQIGSSGIVKNTAFEGSVTGTGSGLSTDPVGGIVSWNDGAIFNCSFSGSVSNGYNCGGLVGNNYGPIKNCYNKSTVSTNVSGGVNGGIVGLSSGGSSLIENCYSAGAFAQGDSGGIVGDFNSGSIKNCYWFIGSCTQPIAYNEQNLSYTNVYSFDNSGISSLINVLNTYAASNPDLKSWTSGTGGYAYPMLSYTTYTISLNPASKAFGSVTSDYTTAPDVETITITNTGNGEVTIPSKPAATNYQIVGTFPMNIAAGGTGAFTIQPKTELLVGTYNETITVSTSQGTSASLSVSFAVTPAVIASASVSGITVPAAGADPALYTSLSTGGVSYTVTGLAWQNENGSSASLINGKFKADTIYQAVIELTAAAGYKFPAGGLTPSTDAGTVGLVSVSGGDVQGNKLTIPVTFAATDPLSVTGITVTNQPSLSYIEGQSLNLTGLAVTLTYNDTSTEEDIVPTQFATKGITANPANGTVLTTAHNTQTIALSCNGQMAYSLPLSVQSASYTISANPTSLAFGSAVENYTTAPDAQTVTITNDGNSTVTLTPPTSTKYTISPSTPASLTAGASTSFTIRPVTGLETGAHDETLTFTTDHITSVDVTVTFTVQAASYGISSNPTSLAFGNVVENYTTAPDAQSVTITNDGNSTVTLTPPTSTKYTISPSTSASLAAGASTSFTIRPVTGLETGAHDETLTFTTDHSTSVDVTVTFTVQSASYAVSANPTSLAFGSVIENYTTAPDAQSVTITNDGNSTVTLTPPTSTKYTISPSTSASLAAGASTSFTIRPITGLGAGAHNETLTFTTDHITSVDVTVSFTVQAASYGISSNPTSLAFGSVIENYATAPGSQTVYITNEGNSPVTLTPPTSTKYTISPSSADSLSAGATSSFTIRPVTGLGIGAHNETLTFSTDHSTSVDITVTFTVQSASYAVSANPTSLAFGSAVESYTTAPASQSVSITNSGNSPVTLTPPTSTKYTISPSSASSLSAGATSSFTIQPVTGLGVGAHNETLTFTTDHSTSVDVTVSFTVQSASYAVSANPTSLAFGSVIENYTTAPDAQSVSITNIGNSTVALTPPTSTKYTISPSTSASLAAEASTSFTIRPVTGLETGAHNETLTFTTDHSTSVDVTVTFTVQSASYAISATPFLKAFMSVAEGESPPAAETITITNTGNQPVTLTQPTATNYTIGTLSSHTIHPTTTAAFTIRPRFGLLEGSYAETIAIQGSGGASANVQVSFTVTEAASYSIGASPSSVDFGTLAQGYIQPDAKTVTVTNTGNQSISLYQPAASHYAIGTLSGTALAPGASATFTVTPKPSLSEGSWNETIHILGSNGVNAEVNAAFACTAPLEYYIVSGNGSTYQQDDSSPSPLAITANGNINNFTGLTLNGVLVDESNYDVRSGSTIVTLHQDFLDTLTPGTYTLLFHYTDGQAEAEFVIQDRMPATGDNDTLLIFGTLMALCILALILLRKKQAVR